MKVHIKDKIWLRLLIERERWDKTMKEYLWNSLSNIYNIANNKWYMTSSAYARMIDILWDGARQYFKEDNG